MPFFKDSVKFINHLRSSKMVDPLRKIQCPNCGEASHPADYAIISTVNKDPYTGKYRQLYDPSSAPYAPFIAPLLSRIFIKSIGGFNDARELAHYQCPKCERPLPRNIESNDSISIAIIGDTGSGKSHYIATIINQLKEAEIQQTGKYRFATLNTETENRYMMNYYNPLIRNHRMLAPTQTATDTINEPLVYELIKQDQYMKKRLNLMIYDAAGEDIVDQRRMARFSSYILNASAIVLLVDPTSIPAVYNQLPPQSRPQSPPTRRAVDVLNSVIQFYEVHKGLRPGSRLDIPIAITFSKSDLLKFMVPSNSVLYNTPSYDGKLNRADQQQVDDEVKNILAHLGEKTLLQASATFSNAQFFAVSSTGSAPNAQGFFQTITPSRCLDPLLWVFSKLHIVDVQ